MNIKLKVFIGLSFVILFSTTTAAHAGFMDWIKGSKTDVNSVSNALQFVGEINLPEIQKIDIVTMNDTSVLQINEVPKVTVKSTPVKARYTVSVSAYSSTVDQTDDSPFITARNTYVRDGIVATNFLPFGTAIKIPAIYGDKIFIVEDRMNRRYKTNVDIWMADRQSALKFGRKNLVIEVL
jgi:3D (Asp-Asp-Asp) domain-containing protein